MTSEAAQKFIRSSSLKAQDKKHRSIINHNIGKYQLALDKGLENFKDLELARQRAATVKTKTLNDLDKYLIEFEQNFISNGGKVLWAVDADEANKKILDILKAKNLESVVKSKSMTTEEIGLNAFLENQQIETIETDLGEFIVQLSGEKPYHIVTPAMHKSKTDIAQLFNEKFEWDINLSAEEMTRKVRSKLRNKFFNADVGITGANFLIADTGSVAITENEGNGLLSMSFPKIHIIIAGIEKVLPSINDLSLFWTLLSAHGTGQNMTVYNSIISGSKAENESDGPQETYVILLNNRRTEILKQEKQKLALTCIRCGACLNVCPIYKNIGGHSYDTTYTGPIGAVISPWLNGIKDYKHLSFASTLCGACTDVCPVKIPLHDLLLENRKKAVEEKLSSSSERFSVKLWTKLMLKRKRLDKIGGSIKNIIASLYLKKMWGPNRELPHLPKKSFHKQWVEKNSSK
jgi:L-lactate dehydrogenase complex protein LldF